MTDGFHKAVMGASDAGDDDQARCVRPLYAVLRIPDTRRRVEPAASCPDSEQGGSSLADGTSIEWTEASWNPTT